MGQNPKELSSHSYPSMFHTGSDLQQVQGLRRGRGSEASTSDRLRVPPPPGPGATYQDLDGPEVVLWKEKT